MKKITIIVVILLVSACSQFAYQALPPHTVLPKDAVPITLDSSYQFYYRAVGSKDTALAGTSRLHKVLSIYNDNRLSNPGIIGSDHKKIIEIEYMWLSMKDSTVIYISTVADRYQNRYSNTDLFAGLDHPNGGDFRVFLIGKINKDDPDRFTFYFKDGRRTDNWEVQKGADKIRLQRLLQKRYAAPEQALELDDAIPHSLTFQLQPDWQIIFLDKNAQNKASLDPMAGHSLYYLEQGKKFSLYIPFTNTTLVFKDKYVIYRPDRKARKK